jgi:hypothetical protein
MLGRADHWRLVTTTIWAAPPPVRDILRGSNTPRRCNNGAGRHRRSDRGESQTGLVQVPRGFLELPLRISLRGDSRSQDNGTSGYQNPIAGSLWLSALPTVYLDIKNLSVLRATAGLKPSLTNHVPQPRFYGSRPAMGRALWVNCGKTDALCGPLRRKATC